MDTNTDQEDLNTLLKKLKTYRADLEDYGSQLKAMITRLETSEDYINMKRNRDTALNLVQTMEEVVKARAVEVYNADPTKNKKINPFITIKNFVLTNVLYDKQKAHEWALRHNTGVLDLNEKSFEKVVVEGKVPKEIATYTQVDDPRGQIAQSLEKLE